jgi:hypothetical protein
MNHLDGVEQLTIICLENSGPSMKLELSPQCSQAWAVPYPESTEFNPCPNLILISHTGILSS